MRSWVQNSQGASVTYQIKKKKKNVPPQFLYIFKYEITYLETSSAFPASTTVDAALEAAKTAASSLFVVLNS